MPLVSIKDEVIRARACGYAVPLIDVFDIQAVEGVFKALLEKRAPAIIGVYYQVMEQPHARALAAYIRTRLEEIDLPVSLMLDHGSSPQMCEQAIAYGYSDVMYDGSRLPFEQNAANTRAIVERAHAVGVAVEAELGHVGMGDEYQAYGGQRKGFTRPEDVERFATETGVDFLAVAIGTAHGLYAGKPQLDLDLLAEIRARVDIPLVLHGGTGLTPEQFRAVIAGGISKINVATDMFVTAKKHLGEVCGHDGSTYFNLLDTTIETYRERSAYYLDLFGASGQAYSEM